MALLTVIRPGLLTTVQDRGRWGWQAYGVAVSGAMDQAAHRLANILVGNSPEQATLEITMTGPEVRVDEEREAAVTGADFVLALNGSPVPMRAAFVVPAGGTLTFGARQDGCRAYLAIGGGMDAPLVLGSRSTHIPSRMGGLDGRALRRDDQVALGAVSRPRRQGVSPGASPVAHSPVASGAHGQSVSQAGLSLLVASRFSRKDVLRVIVGPHDDRFSHDALGALTSQPYRVRSESDRMGFRLDGPPLAHRGRPEIIAEATIAGALQVPASGEPILLMADRQTTGGYPIIATVITADLDVAAQLAPGDSVRFAVCSREEALAVFSAREDELAAAERGIAR